MTSSRARASDALTVQVLPESDDDDQLLDELTALLREELLELDVASVEPVQGEAAEGAKGVFADVVGWLSVALGSGGLEAVATTVAAWVGRSRRSVELTYEGDTLKLVGASPDQMDRALDEWFARHSAGS